MKKEFIFKNSSEFYTEKWKEILKKYFDNK